MRYYELYNFKITATKIRFSKAFCSPILLILLATDSRTLLPLAYIICDGVALSSHADEIDSRMRKVLTLYSREQQS